MGSEPRERWAVICDFDGTAVTEDIGDAVAIHFAGYDVWRAAEDRYLSGQIPFKGLLSGMFAPITATREEIALWAQSRAVLRPGLERFLAHCRDVDRPFVVCSAGLDVYVEAILERLAPELRAHVEVHANRAICTPTGLTVEFHGNGGGCPDCGFCKGTVVDELHGRGFKVAICGDGGADRCAAKRADLIFARGRLPRYCDELGLSYARFETFDDVLAAFPRG
ncbi:MAG TPA: MtnX-like HAD-IB family phosphatase [Anaeromyxobacteraceae bacterium]|nr:MtnX-like HAD-IB family phosphatase [Anaeromyxobacteraceae bacterium]